jgi:hypothetical protein
MSGVAKAEVTVTLDKIILYRGSTSFEVNIEDIQNYRELIVYKMRAVKNEKILAEGIYTITTETCLFLLSGEAGRAIKRNPAMYTNDLIETGRHAFYICREGLGKPPVNRQSL